MRGTACSQTRLISEPTTALPRPISGTDSFSAGYWTPAVCRPFSAKVGKFPLSAPSATPLPYDIIEASPAADGSTPVRPPGLTRNNGARGSQTQVLQFINSYRVSQGLTPINRQLDPLSLNTRDTDLRLSKTFAIKERFKVKLQAEAFNLLNSANFISNSGNAGNAGFGFSNMLAVFLLVTGQLE